MGNQRGQHVAPIPYFMRSDKHHWRERSIPEAAFRAGLGHGSRLFTLPLGGAYLQVISSAIHAEYRGVVVPQFHVSACVCFEWNQKRRCTDDEMERVREAFGMTDAEEDNHSSSFHRNLFSVLGMTGTQCDCKSDETTIVETDGFTWQREAAHSKVEGK